MYDATFLKELDKWPQREVFAKIVSLSWDERPREEIEGYITGGSISVNGASALRRTCNITMATNNVNINDLYWALESKFQVYIGLRNFIDDKYDDIIWFPQGVYIITSYNQTLNTQGYTIQIQGKDKMCLLDGSIGGNIPADHDFGKIEVSYGFDADGSEILKREDILIYDIIREAVHVYAKEDYHNIIINDLEDCSVMLLNYKAKNLDLYIYSRKNSEIESTTNMTFSGHSQIADAFEAQHTVDGGSIFLQEKDTEGNTINVEYQLIKKVTYNDTAGYQLTDLTYVGDLVCAAGSTITQMLDKVASMLGEFEYFYDLEGRFVFQRKKIYSNITWTNQMKTADSEIYYDSLANSSSNIYEFTSGQLIESFANKPQVNMIKNDYTIWGERVSTTGIQIPVHMRYAIDVKPTEYFSLIDGAWYYAQTDEELQESHFAPVLVNSMNPSRGGKVDWRHLLYKMALDWQRRSSIAKDLDKFTEYQSTLPDDTTVEDEIIALTKIAVGTDCLCSQYLASLGRDNVIRSITWLDTKNEERTFSLPDYVQTPNETAAYRQRVLDQYNWLKDQPKKEQDYITWEQQPINLNDYSTYFYDMEAYWPRLYSLDQEIVECEDGVERLWFGWKPDLFVPSQDSEGSWYLYFRYPELIDFWIDFEDIESYLGKYAIQLIGRRTKAVKDTDVKAIFFRETPNILFSNPNDEVSLRDTNMSYDRLTLSGAMANYFVMSAQGKSGEEVMNDLIYQHTYYQESITVNVTPIYYLEPNCRIKVYDATSGINGEYIIQSFTLQLSHDGMMSINATKAEENIL